MFIRARSRLYMLVCSGSREARILRAVFVRYHRGRQGCRAGRTKSPRPVPRERAVGADVPSWRRKQAEDDQLTIVDDKKVMWLSERVGVERMCMVDGAAPDGCARCEPRCEDTRCGLCYVTVPLPDTDTRGIFIHYRAFDVNVHSNTCAFCRVVAVCCLSVTPLSARRASRHVP